MVDQSCSQCEKVFKVRASWVSYGYGKYCSRACFGLSTRGRVVSAEWAEKLGRVHRGRKKTDEEKRKNSEAHKGEKAAMWKGGVSLVSGYQSFMTRRYKIRKIENGGSHTMQEWEDLKRFYNFMCLCCKQQEPFIKLTEDHIVPISRGGSDDISNIQPLCRSCNSIKGVKTVNYLLGDIITP